MKLQDIKIRANALLKRHYLTDWTFQFDCSKKRFGCCDHFNRVISMSKHIAVLNEYFTLKNNILHEIAHALTPKDGHGAKWRATCRRIGARPERCYSRDRVVTPKGKHVYQCPKCTVKINKFRKLKDLHLRYHSTCGKDAKIVKIK